MYVMNFRESCSKDLCFLGGKGANLVRLTRLAEIRVPDGFVITTEAFKRYVRPIVESVRTNVKKAVMEMTLPDDLQTQILSAYAAMGEGRVAVRSSATTEDLAEASFAGQQDSFLNVSGKEELLHAVVCCFASLYNERALAYRAKNDFDEQDREIAMAVVVQRMVDARVSGVLFTADPRTSDRYTTVIEAVEGLGEELVSGRKIPVTWQVKEHIKASGGSPCLTDEQIWELVHLGRKIKDAFGAHQDIEWCLDEQGFQIVQSRPITTLFPCPPSPDGFKRCYISVGHLQMMTDVMLPLGMSLWELMSQLAHIIPVGGRPYMEVTGTLKNTVGGKILRTKTANADVLMDDAVLQVLARKDYIKTIPKGEKNSFSVPWYVIRSLLAGPGIYRKNDPSIIDQYRRRMEEKLEATRKNLDALHGRAVVDYIVKDVDDLLKTLYDPDGLATTTMTFFLTERLDKSGRKLLGEEKVSVELSKWVRWNVTTEMGLAVGGIADAAREHAELVEYLEKAGDRLDMDKLQSLPGGVETARLIEDFFERYGMRCPGEIDITKPGFRERPSQLLSAVLADIHLPKDYARLQAERHKAESDRMAASLISAAGKKWGKRRTARLEKLISFYRNFLGLREAPKYFWIRRYWLYKQALLREAEALVEAGKLHSAEDIWYLRLPELAELLEGREGTYCDKIDSLKKDYAHFAALTPPRFIFSDGEVVEGKYDRQVPFGALPGLAVSGGVAEGRAKVILRIEDAGELRQGDILVTKFTDPSWTPVFLTIGALVTEVGGLATHGAVVSREFGLPCVVGVSGASSHMKDGDRIRVNGDLGYVEILERRT